jgi:hypothetical protein
MLVCLAGGIACHDTTQTDFAAADLTRHGFVRDESLVRKLDGKTIRVRGFVDQANLYGDQGAREILSEWWSGESRDAATWRFDLKARADDRAGRSFAVYVRNDPDRRMLLSAIVDDARAGRATRVDVTGALRTFVAPTNAVAETGLYLEVGASNGVVLVR